MDDVNETPPNGAPKTFEEHWGGKKVMNPYRKVWEKSAWVAGELAGEAKGRAALLAELLSGVEVGEAEEYARDALREAGLTVSAVILEDLLNAFELSRASEAALRIELAEVEAALDETYGDTRKLSTDGPASRVRAAMEDRNAELMTAIERLECETEKLSDERDALRKKVEELEDAAKCRPLEVYPRSPAEESDRRVFESGTREGGWVECALRRAFQYLDVVRSDAAAWKAQADAYREDLGRCQAELAGVVEAAGEVDCAGTPSELMAAACVELVELRSKVEDHTEALGDAVACVAMVAEALGVTKPADISGPVVIVKKRSLADTAQKCREAAVGMKADLGIAERWLEERSTLLVHLGDALGLSEPWTDMPWTPEMIVTKAAELRKRLAEVEGERSRQEQIAKTKTEARNRIMEDLNKQTEISMHLEEELETIRTHFQIPEGEEVVEWMTEHFKILNAQLDDAEARCIAAGQEAKNMIDAANGISSDLTTYGEAISHLRSYLSLPSDLPPMEVAQKVEARFKSLSEDLDLWRSTVEANVKQLEARGYTNHGGAAWQQMQAMLRQIPPAGQGATGELRVSNIRGVPSDLVGVLRDDDGDGFMAIVRPDTGEVWEIRYLWDDIARFQEVYDALGVNPDDFFEIGVNVFEAQHAGLMKKIRRLQAAERQLANVLGSKALADVAAERRRQVESEGWEHAHDDQHSRGDLAAAASCYALSAASYGVVPEGAPDPRVPGVWPWHADWWKPKSRRRDLERAGALILAELERLDRAEGNTIPERQVVHQAGEVPDVDALANFIRTIDGRHTMGAGEMAERIVEWVKGRLR